MHEDGHRILNEAKATVDRLRDSEQRFAAEREALSTVPNGTVESQSHVRFETLNERHRREIEEQDKRFELERIARKYEDGRRQQADWSQWERWADAKIAAALAEERRQVCTAIGEEMFKAIEQVHEDMAYEVKMMRVEIVALKSILDQAFEEMRSMAGKGEVIDMPNQLRKAS
jgi:hypothetical protein